VPEREQRVTPLELFFDLVFVFALTQVTGLMSADPTWHGLGVGLLVLAAVWGAWATNAWLTNALEPEEGIVRLAMFGSMAAMLVVGLAVPESFDDDGVLFGVAYLAMRLLHLVLFVIAGRRDPDLLATTLGLAPWTAIGPALLVVAGFADGSAQATLWLAALTIDYVGLLIRRARGWRISPAHFAERHHLVVIIALGESIVAIGIGAAGGPIGPGVVTAAVLGIAVVAALWWAYFDAFAVMAEHALREESGVARMRLARDYYTYLHLPMIAGVVLFAVGLKKTLEHVDEPLDTVPAVALCGGLGLYFFSHVTFRLYRVAMIRRAGAGRPGWFGLGRSSATVLAVALLPAALELPSLTALSLAAALCCALIVWDVTHYREERAGLREAR
jgi:low temperature requirement protein LtrA